MWDIYTHRDAYISGAAENKNRSPRTVLALSFFKVKKAIRVPEGGQIETLALTVCEPLTGRSLRLWWRSGSARSGPRVC